MSDQYRRKQTFYQDISSNLSLATADTTKTLVTVRNTNYTLFIQKIYVYITTDAAQSLSFQDTAGTPLVIANVITSPGVSTRWEFDFGPIGQPLTSGKSFQVVPSAAGLAANITWEGYSVLNNGVAAASV